MNKAASSRTGYILGWEDFARISAVEDIRYTRQMIADFRDFEKRKVPAAERRLLLARKYGGKA